MKALQHMTEEEINVLLSDIVNDIADEITEGSRTSGDGISRSTVIGVISSRLRDLSEIEYPVYISTRRNVTILMCRGRQYMRVTIKCRQTKVNRAFLYKHVITNIPVSAHAEFFGEDYPGKTLATMEEAYQKAVSTRLK